MSTSFNSGQTAGISSSATSDIDQEPQREQEPQWPTPPKALTLRGVLIGLGIFVMAVVLAVLSVYMRRTQLEKTTAFWGKSSIEAFQYGHKVEITKLTQPDQKPGEFGKIIEVTDLPGLSHLRHAFLEERHYEWPAGKSGAVGEPKSEASEAEWYFVRFENPAGGEPTELVYDARSGAIGPWGRYPEGQLTPRAKKGVTHYVGTLYRDLSKKISTGPQQRGS